jgi:ATP-dependent exoDNAse (exonuclease V) beta subunit
MSTNIKKRAELVPASAGSGKTYRIAHEYLYDVLRDRYDENGDPYFDRLYYKRILAVTFTNKATEEMKTRILEEIHLLASGKKSAHLNDLITETKLDEATLRSRAKIIRSLILHDYSHFTILTNDTFFQRILRAFVRELGIDMNFSTEVDTAPLFDRSVDALLDSATDDKELQEWLIDILKDLIRDRDTSSGNSSNTPNAKWNIRTVLNTLKNELFNESRKEIIANIDKDKWQEAIAAFDSATDTESITKEIKELAKGALEQIDGDEYLSKNLISYPVKLLRKAADGTLKAYSTRDISFCDLSPEEWFKARKATPEYTPLVSEKIQSAYVTIYNKFTQSQTNLNTLRILRKNLKLFSLLTLLREKMQDVCREENSMLISETKHTISDFISESDAPFIYEKVGSYFEKFMIDEFQDTSVKEWNNFLPLLRNAMSQSTDNSVLIVGDVKQSIYRWRGGDWRILGQKVQESLPECARTPLPNNWRSLKNIVAFNNMLYAPEQREPSEENKQANANSAIALANADLNSRLAQAYRDKRISKECRDELFDTLNNAYNDYYQVSKKKQINNGYVYIATLSSNTENGDKMLGKSQMPLYVERIKEVLERGFLPRDITIIVRTNKEAMDFAEELLSFRSQFPPELYFEITTEEALKIASSPAVKFIIAVMRLAINREDVTSLTLYNQIHNNCRFDLKLSEEENIFLDTISVMSPEEAFEHISIRYADTLKGQTAYVMALHEHIAHFSTGKTADIALFDAWWKDKCEELSVKVERSDRSIQILTIHKSKGLENKVILIPKCDWELKPKGGSIIWAKPTKEKNLSAIEAFPVPYNSDVEKSYFAEEFYREQIYNCVDGLNILYVATTRAKEQLHIFIPKKESKDKKSEYSSIHTLLLDIFSSKMTQDEGVNYRYYELGTFDAPELVSTRSEEEQEDKKIVKNVIIEEHNASPISIKLRTSASRYFSEDEAKLTPRSIGILLHRAFENAATRDEIFAALDAMNIDGILNSADLAILKEQVSTTLDTTDAGEWFDGSWDNLYRERNIIRPKSSSTRPDRVLTRGNEAVIVDYKFGKESDKHEEKMMEYIDEVRSMGFTSVKGYLWYVPKGKVAEIKK